MGLFGSTRAVNEVWKIVSELDLAKIRERAERPFALLVLGSGPEADHLAAAMSRHGPGAGIHPWLAVARLPLAPGPLPFRPNLALLVLTDPDPGPAEQEALRRLEDRGLPVLTVVTGAEAAARVGAELVRDGEDARVLIPDLDNERAMSQAMLGAVRELLGEDMAEAELSVGRHLPAFRDAVLSELIEETARANAIYSFTTGLGEMVPILTVPLVIGDTVILTKNQLLMAYKIALVAGKSGDPRDLMGEIVSVIGGGLLFRQIAKELVGLIPVIGIVPKVAVSYAGTRAIGATVRVWAVEERRPSADEVRTFYRAAMVRGRKLANQLIDKARREKKAPKQLPPPDPVAPADSRLPPRSGGGL